MRSGLVFGATAFLAVGCGGDEEEPGWSPELYCPGDPSGVCDALPGTPLLAGTASRSVVPTCYESWVDLDDNATYAAGEGETFLDCGCDRLCPGDAGYTGADEGEGDGVFQAIWLGGFQNSRPASGVRDATLGLRGEGDGLYATAIVLSQGNTTLGIVAIDAVGWMIDDVTAMREAVRAAGVDVDHLVVHSSHVHEAPDTMGIWGPTISETGYDAAYAEEVYAAVADAVVEAHGAMEEVEVELGAVDAGDYADNGVANLISDTRDPVIVPPLVSSARFFRPDGSTVATLVHWANHPETVADDNALFTSDFVHALRLTVSEGVQWDGQEPRDGVGGRTLFLNGAVGGMMTSLRADVLDPTGVLWSEHSFEKADVVGQIVGEMVLDGLEDPEPVDWADLWFRVDELQLPVDNTGFQAMFILGVIGHRQTYNYDDSQPIDEDNWPWVATEVDLIGLGPLRLLTIPGEPLPELAIGGYDGSFTPPGEELVDLTEPNAPDVSAAPGGPYWHDLMGGEHPWVIGLANDEVGYIIPEYNFVVAEAGAYIFEADGDHYEETNSLGPQTAGLITESIERLVSW